VPILIPFGDKEKEMSLFRYSTLSCSEFVSVCSKLLNASIISARFLSKYLLWFILPDPLAAFRLTFVFKRSCAPSVARNLV